MEPLQLLPPWTPAQLASHKQVAAELDEIKGLAFAAIAEAVRSNTPLTEYDIQQLILQEFERRHIVTSDGEPIVAVNENSRHPHYFPKKESSPITKNCWILLDIWGKHAGEDTVFADITWVAYTGNAVSAKHQEIFAIVCQARDLVVEKLQAAWKANQQLEGWQLDRLARDHITERGYGEQFIHTTGHSLGTGESVHAPGVGLNDRSQHDTRPVLPGNGITIEPGIYLPEFGMRTEIDLFMDPQEGPIITTDVQREITLLT
jgi:Xaa-Pro aminopeptidase